MGGSGCPCSTAAAESAIVSPRRSCAGVLELVGRPLRKREHARGAGPGWPACRNRYVTSSPAALERSARARAPAAGGPSRGSRWSGALPGRGEGHDDAERLALLRAVVVCPRPPRTRRRTSSRCPRPRCWRRRIAPSLGPAAPRRRCQSQKTAGRARPPQRQGAEARPHVPRDRDGGRGRRTRGRLPPQAAAPAKPAVARPPLPMRVRQQAARVGTAARPASPAPGRAARGGPMTRSMRRRRGRHGAAPQRGAPTAARRGGLAPPRAPITTRASARGRRHSASVADALQGGRHGCCAAAARRGRSARRQRQRSRPCPEVRRPAPAPRKGSVHGRDEVLVGTQDAELGRPHVPRAHGRPATAAPPRRGAPERRRRGPAGRRASADNSPRLRRREGARRGGVRDVRASRRRRRQRPGSGSVSGHGAVRARRHGRGRAPRNARARDDLAVARPRVTDPRV